MTVQLPLLLDEPAPAPVPERVFIAMQRRARARGFYLARQVRDGYRVWAGGWSLELATWGLVEGFVERLYTYKQQACSTCGAVADYRTMRSGRCVSCDTPPRVGEKEISL